LGRLILGGIYTDIPPSLRPWTNKPKLNHQTSQIIAEIILK